MMNAKKAILITNNVKCERHAMYYGRVEKYLKANDYEIVLNFEEAEKVIICGCGFHEFMYKKIVRLFNDLKQKNFSWNNVFVLGCTPKTNEDEIKKDFSGVIIPLGEESRMDVELNAKIPFDKIESPNVLLLPSTLDLDLGEKIYNIKINQGCLKECTYCVINRAKGMHVSIPQEKILNEFRVGVQNGYKQFFLAGEDVFAYGIDTGTNIMELVDSMLSIEENIVVRFGYWHIRWLHSLKNGLGELLRKGIVNRLHIGLQHVDEKMLKLMGRKPEDNDWYQELKYLKEQAPNLYIGADIIVGFPGETNEIFEEMLNFFKNDTLFDYIEHFGYSDMPGTKAAGLPGKVTRYDSMMRFERLKEVLGKRSHYNSEVDDEQGKRLQIAFNSDYIVCKDTYIDCGEEVST